MGRIKVVHFNTYASGGAFTGLYRMHLSLLKHGIDSKIVVRDLKEKSGLIQTFEFDGDRRVNNFIFKVLRRINIGILSEHKIIILSRRIGVNLKSFSFYFSNYDLTSSKYFKDSDIVQLHWVANFLDFRTFFQKCNKPVVFTLRDKFLFYGLYHYDCEVGNDAMLNDLDAFARREKAKCINSLNEKGCVVGISKWIANEAANSNVFSKYPIEVVYNCIDFDKFIILDKEQCRDFFSLPKDCLIISFASFRLNDDRKCVDLLLKLIVEFSCIENVIFITCGNSNSLISNEKVVNLGELNEDLMVMFYNCSDYHLFLTKEDSFGNVLLEALSCGLTTISSNYPVATELIEDKATGFLVQNDFSQLVTLLSFLIANDIKFDRFFVRNSVLDRFSEESLYNKYLEIYSNLV